MWNICKYLKSFNQPEHIETNMLSICTQWLQLMSQKSRTRHVLLSKYLNFDKIQTFNIYLSGIGTSSKCTSQLRIKKSRGWNDIKWKIDFFKVFQLINTFKSHLLLWAEDLIKINLIIQSLQKIFRFLQFYSISQKQKKYKKNLQCKTESTWRYQLSCSQIVYPLLLWNCLLMPVSGPKTVLAM